MKKLVVMLRVKDGDFYVKEWLACYEKLADEIVVLDNGSTDNTCWLLAQNPKVVQIIITEGYNEGRDKNLLYKEVRKRQPDWCLWVDIDEIFEPQLTRTHLNKMMDSKTINKYAFRRFHFVDTNHFAGSWFRLKYSAGHDRIMWRECGEAYFENLLIDSPNIKGVDGIKWRSHYRIKHLGYINKDLVDKKAGIYRNIIPEKEHIFQEMYMRNERAIKWIDDNKNIKVVLLNVFLDCVLAVHAYYKIRGGIFKIFQPKHPSKTITMNNPTTNIRA